MENFLGAEKGFSQVIALDSTNAKAFLNRGYAREFMGNFKGACSDWTKARDLGLTEAEDYLDECDGAKTSTTE